MKKKATEMQVMGSEEAEAKALEELLDGSPEQAPVPEPEQAPAQAAPPTRAELVALQSDDEKLIQKLRDDIAKIETRMKTRNATISEIDKQEQDKKINDFIEMMKSSGITPEQFAKRLNIKTTKTETKTPAAKTPGEPKAERADLPPKYRNPETGETWTGRGKPVLSIKLKRIKYRNPANPSETWHGWEEFGQPPAWYTPDLPAQKNAARKDLYPDELLIDNQA